MAAEHGADGAVNVADGEAAGDRGFRFEGRLGFRDQLMIERLIEAVVLLLHLAARNAGGNGWRVEDGGEIDALGLPVGIGDGGIDLVDAADHLVDLAEAKLGHVLADLFGDEEEEVDDVFGLAGEALAQDRVLGGDADGAGVEVALAHHDAAHGDERRGGEAEFLSAEKGGDDDVAAGLEFAVGLDLDAAAKIVEQQDLLGFGEAEFPGKAGVLDGTERGCAGSASVAGDEDDVGVGFGYARSDGADANFGDELDGDAGLGVDVFEVVDQLREIFDGIDVVVRRRRDEADAGDGVARPGDDVVDLVAGELATFAGFCALRHLDLQFVGVDEVVGGDAEAAAGYLLDGAAARVAVRVGLEARFVFAAFAGVGHAAEAVHGDGEGFVGFLADGAEAHGAGGEALDDFLGGLDFFDWNRRVAVLQLEQAAKGAEVAILLIEEVGVFLEGGGVVGANRVLEFADGCRIEQVVLTAFAVLIMAADDQFGFGFGERLKGEGVLHLGFACEHIEADAFDARCGAREVGFDQMLIEADGFEDLGAAIALQRADAHLGEGLEQALVDGLDEVLLGVIAGDAVGQKAAALEIVQRFDSEVRIDRAGAVSDEEREVHDFARLTALDDERDLGAGLLLHEAVVDRGHREKAGDGRVGGVDAAVGDDEQRVSGGDGVRGAGAEFVQGAGEAGFAIGCAEESGKRGSEQIAGGDAAQFLEIAIGKDRMRQLESVAVLRRSRRECCARCQCS